MGACEGEPGAADLFYVRGEAGGALDGSDAALVAWRKRCGLYCGDWALHVAAAPRRVGGWPAFAARAGLPPPAHAWHEGAAAEGAGGSAGTGGPEACDGSGSDSGSEAGSDCGSWGASLDGRLAAEVLFDATNWGTVVWSWGEASGFGGVYARDGSGARFNPRVFVELEPDATGVEEARKEARDELAQMPQEIYPDEGRRNFREKPKPGIAKEDMALRIDADLDGLAVLVEQAGSFGAASLPDALSPITVTLHCYRDGNERVAAFGTDAYWFYISMETS